MARNPTYRVTLEDNEEPDSPSTKPTGSTSSDRDSDADTPSESPSTSSVDSLKQELADSVGKRVESDIITRIGKRLGLTEEEAEEELPKDKESLERVVDSIVEQRLEEQNRQAKEQQEQSKAEYEERVQGIIKDWYNQYEALARSGKVPKVEDTNDPEDKGVKARQRIIQEIGDLIEKNKKEGVDYIPTVQDVVLQNPDIGSQQVPGSKLPISGNSRAGDSSATFSNKEIRDKSFYEIAAEQAG